MTEVTESLVDFLRHVIGIIIVCILATVLVEMVWRQLFPKGHDHD